MVITVLLDWGAELTSGPQVWFRVGAFPSVSAAMLPFALARALEQFPRMTFAPTEASSPQLVDHVVSKRLDVAVVASGPDLPQPALEGLRLSPLPRSELVGVPRGHPLAGTEGTVPARELAHAAWIIEPLRVGHRSGDGP
ncbi:LysR substrate-binding domain-containing protein [Streptomyces sp. NPDC087844]|uniref:LysR substrate-binding domain-containing protein n=1 Tax=Streptomyces sp. NPDC087844 TaxID=3365805 RepID=UPI00380B2545